MSSVTKPLIKKDGNNVEGLLFFLCQYFWKDCLISFSSTSYIHPEPFRLNLKSNTCPNSLSADILLRSSRLLPVTSVCKTIQCCELLSHTQKLHSKSSNYKCSVKRNWIVYSFTLKEKIISLFKIKSWLWLN